jgi:hypothetical protein
MKKTTKMLNVYEKNVELFINIFLFNSKTLNVAIRL